MKALYNIFPWLKIKPVKQEQPTLKGGPLAGCLADATEEEIQKGWLVREFPDFTRPFGTKLKLHDMAKRHSLLQYRLVGDDWWFTVDPNPFPEEHVKENMEQTWMELE